MHQRSVSLSCHPHGGTSPATRSGVSKHARVRQSPAAQKEGRSVVRGTQESDRPASLAPAETEVRARAVLPGSGGPEHQTACALPQPTDNPGSARHHLVEPKKEELSSRPLTDRAMLCLRDFFNSHRRLHKLAPSVRLSWRQCVPWRFFVSSRLSGPELSAHL